MKIIHKNEIKPQYSFPEWDKELRQGYIFYIDDSRSSFYKVLLRFKDWFLVKKVLT